MEKLKEVLSSVETDEEKSKDSLKDLLNRKLDFGPTLVEQIILSSGLRPYMKMSEYGQ